VKAPRVLLVCGSGGVGKTTISAALSLRLAEEGERVVVLTIDPARRLADALGIGELDNQPRRVPTERGELRALMLDAKKTFDDLVARHAPSAEVRDRILGNHYYRFASERLPGVHEYMAMERLLSLVRDEEADVIVLDTPPTRHALDFLAAPDRMAGLMDEGVMRWLVLPATASGWRMLEMGSDVLAGVLKRLLGPETIADIAEFFTSFQGLWAGFRERSLAVRALLRDPRTRFFLVTAPAPGARAEAIAFLEVLQADAMPFAGFFINRCAPAAPAPAAWPATPPHRTDAEWAALREEVEVALARRALLLGAQERAIAELLAHAPRGSVAWRIAEQPTDVHDLHSLRRLGGVLAESGAIHTILEGT
jgi:anion-transporting  ArsA/GET3 family ATPase